MTDVGSVYGSALYTLARDESISASVLEELPVLEQSFRQEPGFLRLLSTPALSKVERCKILDDSFRGKVEPYVLNFMKILTEMGYMSHFTECCETYRDRYNEENGITPTQIKKEITNALALERKEKDEKQGARRYYDENIQQAIACDPIVEYMSAEQLKKSIERTRRLMLEAADKMEFIEAAQYRDEMFKLQELLKSKAKQ